uniref:DOXA1 factor n=1 Tax=Zonotrichia albicollis TaxID=44394 RepID=A0A8D2NBS0_ZONAL
MTLWNGSYPFYPGANACFPFDTTRAVIVTVFLSMLATFIIILPGIPGRRRLLWFLRLVLGLFVGAVILNVQFTRDWERGWVQANTSYKSFSPAQVSADIGLHIGLAGLNVTSTTRVLTQLFGLISRSDIRYLLEQGQLDQVVHGFIPPLGYGEQSLSRFSKPGVLCCVLWSFFRLAFCTWLISILLFSMSILLYGGQMLLLTGTLILSSLLLFSTARNSLRCPIQFGPVSMRTDYGESFWLALATGECSACFWGSPPPSLHRGWPSAPPPFLLHGWPQKMIISG